MAKGPLGIYDVLQNIHKGPFVIVILIMPFGLWDFPKKGPNICTSPYSKAVNTDRSGHEGNLDMQIRTKTWKV